MPDLILEYSEGKPLERIVKFRHRFACEPWTLYSIAVVVVLLRFYARWRRFGFRGIAPDDVLMMVAIATLTTMTYGINEHLKRGAGTIYIPPDVVPYLTPEQYNLAATNGKWIFTIAHMQVLTLWSAKACMIIIYMRITEGLAARRWVIGVAIYVILAFVGVELGLFLGCVPVRKRWTPAMDNNCAFYDNFQVTDAVLSVTSTFTILVAGLPVLLKAKLQPRQKWIVMILFGLGVFDLAADITAKVLIASMRSRGFVYYSWYMRVCFVALLVCNLPYTWSLLMDWFPAIRTWSTQSGGSVTLRFWRERRWTHSSVGSLRRSYGSIRRKHNASARTPTPPDSGRPDEEKMQVIHFPAKAHKPATERFSAKWDAAVLERMVGGELEDDLDVGKSRQSKLLFLDIESAVAHVRDQAFNRSGDEDSDVLGAATSPSKNDDESSTGTGLEKEGDH